MSASGVGPFDNDHAMDLVDDSGLVRAFPRDG
ncbi:DUF4259 domain-containing protein [Kibdelosporangium philippinense]|uniref:DUF4259 domain-containing protein n=1 Tax=Kibdelosporangium philippinense TaxID=211113 RepID=A0ABS8ZPA1_9PSEU|nr:DUF4259 domain-containing protein [Kibdelosporangium philippinense]MCE7009593.1 DUF4259 domain-containing protein [Kibdelosporangium philippinense]